MELTLTHHTATQISVSCDGQLSHMFDVSIIPASTHADEPPELTDPQVYGRAVYQALFPPGTPARSTLDGQPERLLLVLTANDLDAVGWEYAYGPFTSDYDEFLVSACHVVRGLPAEQRIAAPELDESLHIVAVPSNPLSSQVPPLNIEGEWLRLRDIIGSLTSACRLERARPPTLEQVRRLVANQRQRVVHFMGHGGQSEQRSCPVFERENGELAAVTAQECIQRLRGMIFLITLNACASAAPAATPFGNLAAAFMRQKTPYALGMRLSIPDKDARAFSRIFYSELASGSPVEEALRQARLVLAKSERPWVIGVPVLYTALSRPPQAFRHSGTTSY